MEARPRWSARMAAGLLLIVSAGTTAANLQAAGYRTTNFEVAAPTPQLAKEIGDAAEVFRRDLAVDWLGKELPAWSRRCPIKARVSPQLGAGGATSFLFDRGEVYGWRMNIQGSRIRVLDSVLPHEVTHTIFASHFRRPLPRWADEGACTTVEHRSEIAKQEKMLIEFLKTRRALPFSQMMMMKEYPADVMPLYSQGHSVARYLIARRGKSAFLEFVADGMKDENWPRAVREHYGYKNLLDMQNTWLGWIKQGRPAITADRDSDVLLASAKFDRTDRHRSAAGQSEDPSTRLVKVAALPQRPAPNLIYRGELTNRPAPARQGTNAADAADKIPPKEGRSTDVLLEWHRPNSD